MVTIAALWLPIVLSGVLVFVVSSIIHMVFKYHRSDFAPMPDEAATRAALGKQQLSPGQYVVPCVRDMKEMRSPEMVRKRAEGPVAFITVLPNGPVNMGKQLLLWFLYSIGIAVFVAYLTSRMLAPGTAYLQVFRLAGTIAFLGYAGAVVWTGIWKGVPWSNVGKDVFDGLVYALLTAGAFAGFWPE